MDSGGSDSEEVEHSYKVIVLGNGAVGKTSLIRRYCADGFGHNYKQTIGLDFYSKKVKLQNAVNVTLHIWDIGGQQIGGSMIHNYICDANAVVFVYDVTNPDSFKDVEDWCACVTAALHDTSNILQVLIGNKIDLPFRQVTTSMHEEMAERHHMRSFFTSARSGEKIHALFTGVAAHLSGVQLTLSELETVDPVVAEVMSEPTEHMAVLRATQVGKVHPSNDNDCSLM